MKKIIIFIFSLTLLFIYLFFNSAKFQDFIVNRAVSGMLPPQFLDDKDSLRALVCGSRSPIPDMKRAEACILVEAGNDLYIFDTGNGSTVKLNNWGVPWNNLKGIFYTHLHSDHISEIAEVHLASWIQGNRKTKLPVYGPLGTKNLTDGIELAYKKDYQFRYEHHGKEIADPNAAGFKTTEITYIDNPIVETRDLKILPFIVPHDPVKPALGYKIIYKDRSIVISGDTIYSEEVLSQSKDVDVLFHEVMSVPLLDLIKTTSERIGNTTTPVIIVDVQDYHTPVHEVVDLAIEANVGHLIFYHMLPAPRNKLMENVFFRGVNKRMDNWTASVDGTLVTLPTGSKEIILETLK